MEGPSTEVPNQVADPVLGPGLRVLRSLAFFVIVIAGLQAASAIVVPVLLAALISLICYPAVRRLTRWRVPQALAIALVILLILLILVFLTTVMSDSVARFTGSLGEYELGLDGAFQKAAQKLEDWGLEITKEEFSQILETRAVLRLISSTADSLFTAISDVALLLLIVLFMLLEAHGFPAKLRDALGRPGAGLGEFHRASSQIYRYLALKAVFGLATGILMGALCLAFGIDYPILWGVFAFLFNFVPTVGSYISPIPPVILALIQHGVGTSLAFAVVWVAATSVQGQVIEPAVMGHRLGLSPLVVFLSLIFWNWVLGPVGMVLSLPLTMIVKILLEQDASTRFVAVLLGPTGTPPPGTPTGDE